MHPELTAALAPILADLAVPSGVEATVSEQEWQDHPRQRELLPVRS